MHSRQIITLSVLAESTDSMLSIPVRFIFAMMDSLPFFTSTDPSLALLVRTSSNSRGVNPSLSI